jgi:hypothetical protein
MATTSTRISRHVNAPRANVYRALLDARAIATWMVPSGMTSHVHAFDAREGGSFRISLTYDAPTGTGKTTAHTDTYHGRFVKLVPNEQVCVEVTLCRHGSEHYVCRHGTLLPLLRIPQCPPKQRCGSTKGGAPETAKRKHIARNAQLCIRRSYGDRGRLEACAWRDPILL